MDPRLVFSWNTPELPSWLLKYWNTSGPGGKCPLPWASQYPLSHFFHPNLSSGTSWTCHNLASKWLKFGSAGPCKTLLQTYSQHPIWLVRAWAIFINIIPAKTLHFLRVIPPVLITLFHCKSCLFSLSLFLFLFFLDSFQSGYLSNLSSITALWPLPVPRLTTALLFYFLSVSETTIFLPVFLLPISLPFVLLCWFLLIFLTSKHWSALGLAQSWDLIFLSLYVHSLVISSSPRHWILAIPQSLSNFYLLLQHFPWNQDSNIQLSTLHLHLGVYISYISNLSCIKLYLWSSPQKFSYLLPVWFISAKGNTILPIAQSKILVLRLDCFFFSHHTTIH